MLVTRKREFFQIVNGSLKNLQFLANAWRIQHAPTRSFRLERRATLNAREQLREADAQRISNADDGRQAKILSPRLEVPKEGSMHLAVICKGFLRCKAPLDADLANPSSELFQDFVHSQSFWEWLSEVLPIVQ